MKKKELPPRDSITVSPITVALEAGKWQASSLFKVQNNTDETLHKIRVKLTVDHPHIRIQDFTIESSSPIDKFFEEVLRDKDSEGKKAKYLVIKRLDPGEIWQFIIAKNSPYIDPLRRQPVIRATVLSFERSASG